MAEAHQAVAFQFSVTDEGTVSVRFDREAVWLTLKAFFSGVYRSRYTKLRNAVFPASPVSLVVILAVTFALRWCGPNPSLIRLSWLESSHWYIYGLALVVQSLVLWVLFSYVKRYALKGLLMYKGWMFDVREIDSTKTKLWALMLKLVSGSSHLMLFSYQSSLPRLPVPSVDGTCKRYLASVRALLSEKDFQEMEKLVEEFKNGPGKKMQRYLILKSWWSPNYVSDWWEQYVYLYGRSPIMINSNYYACDTKMTKTKFPAARAAMLTYAAFRMKNEIENETLSPLMLRKLIPLCSFQYRRLFGTCRIPGKEMDKLVHVPAEQSRHIVAYRKGLWYKVPVFRKNAIMSPTELECQFQKIWDSEGEAGPGEEKLAALTAHSRPFWADARSEFFSSGVNKESMTTIESAAFIIFFDDSSPTIETKDGNCDQLTSYCKSLLHGTGYNNWFDKSLSVRIFSNGKMGLNAEHAWADAPITGHFMEYCCNVEDRLGYRQDGHCNGPIPASVPVPQRIRWDIPPLGVSRIEEALTSVQACIDDLDLYVIEHNAFGKGVMKKCKLSPDAFIQMALQLAYFKDSGGKFCLTYEASMTRLYREGRTETVRPVSVQSAEFVRAMCDPNRTDEERRRLLSIATDKHTEYYKLAMTGKGVDRHLFCLYVLSKYLKIESPFLAKVLGEPWRLSTSQTPTQFTQLIDYNTFPEKVSPGGGFGPVTKDGYGVSYIIPGDNLIYFHVSSFKSSEHTNSRRFAQHIKESLRDMRALYTDAVSKKAA